MATKSDIMYSTILSESEGYFIKNGNKEKLRKGNIRVIPGKGECKMYTELKCKNCTAPLKIDIARKTAVCPYCKSEYAAEDIVNHYITNNVVTNTTNIANMHADVVTILDESSSEQRLNAADQWMLFNEWGKALSIYAEVCETTPQNYRGWNGRALAESNLLAVSLPGEISVLDDLFNRVSDYIKKAMSTAPLQEKTVVEHTKTAFAHNMKASVLEIRKRVLNKLSHVEDAEDSTSSVNGLLKRINTLDNNLEAEKTELKREENLLAYLENESSRADKRMYGLRHPGRLGAIIGAILILCIDYLLL